MISINCNEFIKSWYIKWRIFITNCNGL